MRIRPIGLMLGAFWVAMATTAMPSRACLSFGHPGVGAEMVIGTVRGTAGSTVTVEATLLQHGHEISQIGVVLDDGFQQSVVSCDAMAAGGGILPFSGLECPGDPFIHGVVAVFYGADGAPIADGVPMFRCTVVVPPEPGFHRIDWAIFVPGTIGGHVWVRNGGIIVGDAATPTRTPTVPTPTPSPTFPTKTPTITRSPSPTSTPRPPTITPTPPVTATPTRTFEGGCPGDCNSDGEIDDADVFLANLEYVSGSPTLVRCPSADRNGDGIVTVDEFVAQQVGRRDGIRSCAGEPVESGKSPAVEFGVAASTSETIDLSLRTNGQDVAAVQLDVDLHPPINDLTCTSAYDATFRRFPSGCGSDECEKFRFLLFPSSTLAPIPDGTTLARCEVTLEAGTPSGFYSLGGSLGLAASPRSGRLPLVVSPGGVLVRSATRPTASPAQSPNSFPTITLTPTITGTLATPTSTTRTPTPTHALCAGDCNGDQVISGFELEIVRNGILSSRHDIPRDCFPENATGVNRINQLVQANRGLLGLECPPPPQPGGPAPRLVIGTYAGTAEEIAPVLQSNGHSIVSLQADLEFSRVFMFECRNYVKRRDSIQRQDCRGMYCTGARSVLHEGLDPIPDGTKVFGCQILDDGIPAKFATITASNAFAATADGALLALEIVPGEIQIGTPATATPTAPPPTATRTPMPPLCTGDCNGDRRVSVDELVRGVRRALGYSEVAPCRGFSADSSGQVAMFELIRAVKRSLEGCPVSRNG